MIDGEGHEISLVDPDEIGTDCQSAIEFGLVVDLHQYVQTETAGKFVEGPEFTVVQGGGYEKNAIRSHESGIADIEGRHGEVLAEYR